VESAASNDDKEVILERSTGKIIDYDTGVILGL